MKKIIVSFFVACSVAGTVCAQEHKDVDAVVGKFQQYFNSDHTDSLYAMLSTRIQQLMPLEKTKAMMQQLHGQMGDFNSYQYSSTEGKMTYYKVAFKNVNAILIASLDEHNKMDVFRFTPDKTEENRNAAGASDITMTRDGAVIHGTLTMPDVKGKVPVVLLIAGSGPTDRDGNNTMGVTAASYRLLADSLRNAGIACVRYDKRGIGESAAASKSEADMSFDDIVNDAAGFVGMLNKDERFSGVIVAGHSEGSLVGMVAAGKGGVKKYISISGIADPADKVLKVQLASFPQNVRENADVVMDSLKKGYSVANVHADLMMLFRPSIQPYMRSWLKYDPQAEIKKLKIPVMLVQGDNDVQVATSNAQQLKKALPVAKLVIFKDMTHVLKDAAHDHEKNMATYKNAALPLTPGLASTIISFIKK
ncbi:hypothetical protein CJD36_019705 [Flavipsychrobacter stenotrophus]|uniref:Alpha/beta hydrolase n=1 Tax=Flavipsychrobacter stenotrophus TaxID=2077091 RepID=A0A2S7SRX7_9BACT|nr:alpha/beta fold hydrolase [Flavipsychrobacter stenotrophus]PQJ09468.1 hypothetical protein CJD36_019705 [Flavipsychrobacter stenotrophus]